MAEYNFSDLRYLNLKRLFWGHSDAAGNTELGLLSVQSACAYSPEFLLGFWAFLPSLKNMHVDRLVQFNYE